MSGTLILSVGIDPLTLYAREAVLRSAGYIVVSAMSIKEAFHLFLDGDFDLMVLCHTLPVRDRERLTCLIRASGSRIPVACISGTPGEQTAFSDATLEENSVESLAGVRRLLARRFEVVSIGSWNPPVSGSRLPRQALLAHGGLKMRCSKAMCTITSEAGKPAKRSLGPREAQGGGTPRAPIDSTRKLHG
jgi:CheY-like chemotaxis protein